MIFLSSNKRRLENAFQKRTKPLISDQLGMVVFLSPKVGFTYGCKWFFDHLGILEEALCYSEWIHDYRMEVFNKSVTYQQSLKAYIDHPAHFTTIKLVRDPYDRAVSSYIHANKTGYDDKAIKLFLDPLWSSQPGERFSFREFIQYLRSIDLTIANPHHALQSHVTERDGIVQINHVIRLPDANQRLPEIEELMGLKHLDLSKYRSSAHHTKRLKVDGFVGDDHFDFMQYRETENMKAPPSSAFYDMTLRDQVSTLYREDFERYEFDS